jgi:hypothetical protein
MTDEGYLRYIDMVAPKGPRAWEIPVQRQETALAERNRQTSQTDANRQSEPAEGEDPVRSLSQYDPDDIFGPEAMGETMLDRTLGILTESAQRPETRSARTAYSIARELATKAFRSSGKVSNQEANRILGMLPQIEGVSGFFESVGGSVDRLNTFIDEVKRIQSVEQRFANDPQEPASERSAARDRIRTYQHIVDALSRIKGVSAQKGQTSSNGGNGKNGGTGGSPRGRLRYNPETGDLEPAR